MGQGPRPPYAERGGPLEDARFVPVGRGKFRPGVTRGVVTQRAETSGALFDRHRSAGRFEINLELFGLLF